MVWTAGVASKRVTQRTPIAAYSSRRQLLFLSGGCVTAFGNWAHAAESNTQQGIAQQRQKTFVSDDSGFKFAYPESWAIAIVRACSLVSCA